MEEKCYHRDPGGAFTEENCPCPCSFCAEKNHGKPMTEPSMEWGGVSEKILAVLAVRFDRSFSVDDYIELVDKAISEAEQRGYEKGAAEERRRISEEVEKIKENYNGKCVKPEYYIESRWKDRDEGARNCCDKVISLIHDTK